MVVSKMEADCSFLKLEVLSSWRRWPVEMKAIKLKFRKVKINFSTLFKFNYRKRLKFNSFMGRVGILCLAVFLEILANPTIHYFRIVLKRVDKGM